MCDFVDGDGDGVDVTSSSPRPAFNSADCGGSTASAASTWHTGHATEKRVGAAACAVLLVVLDIAPVFPVRRELGGPIVSRTRVGGNPGIE